MPLRLPDFARSARMIALLVAFAVGGCASADDLAGVWRGAPTSTGSLNLEVNGVPVGVEIVLGQYGPDLAGVVRWWSSDEFVVERSAEEPDSLCACGLVRAGKVGTAGNKATFWLSSCLPGAATETQVRTRVDLTLAADGVSLEAVLTVDDETSALHGQSRTVSLVRTLPSSEVTSAELRCGPPGADGNGSSGL